jgi:hypothetical protein
LFDRWVAAGRVVECFALAYTGAERQVPSDTIRYFQGICAQPGMSYDSVAYKDLLRQWRGGVRIPGIGTRAEYCVSQGLAENATPNFPFAYATMARYAPGRELRKRGNRGAAAAKESAPYISRDYSKLRPAELYVFDDKDLNISVLDELTGHPYRPTVYFAMDVCARYITAYITRPMGKILKRDVDALVGRVLYVGGLGNGYRTHLLFERGTTACSPAREAYLLTLFGERLGIHRTGMLGGKSHAGAHAEAASGHWRAKGMLEAFMRKLDLITMYLPGQLGKEYQEQPAELAARAAEAERLALIKQATGVTLELPLLTSSEFRLALHALIDAYHRDPEHDLEGFGELTEIETAPGQYQAL